MRAVPLTWEVTDGAGTIVNAPSATGEDGTAGAFFRGDVTPGYSYSQHSVKVSSPAGEVVFLQTTGVSRLPNGSMAELPSVQLLTPSEEDRTLSGEAGSIIPKAISVRVFVVGGMQSGQPVKGVEFRIVNADDPEQEAPAECASSAVTDDTGTAVCDLRLSGAPGIYRIAANVGEARITPGIMLTVRPAAQQPVPSKPPVPPKPPVQPEPPVQPKPPVQPPAPAPAIRSITNAASFAEGVVSPGEIITIFGENLGPATAVSLKVDASGLASRSLGGAMVYFDGVAAPVTYACATQISAAVPYGLAGRQTTEVTVEFKGGRSTPVRLRVMDSAPGLFVYSSGSETFAAALNENGSTNGPGNGAAPGSVMVFYATGEGQTDPPGVDGKVAGAELPKPVLPVSVKFGGVPGEVLYAGGAPGMVAGMMQINARVPDGMPSGTTVPVSIVVGEALSQPNVMVAIG